MTIWTPAAQEVFDERLTIPGETPERALRRVAATLGLFELYERMAAQDFFPNSPAIRALGDWDAPGGTHACYVIPVEDSIDGIFHAIHVGAKVHQSGGGTGYGFSGVRPFGFPVGSTKGVASGPISFMQVFNAATETIKQGSQRRGANMATLSVYHPDVVEFVSMKADRGVMTNFNVSVLVDAEFFEAVDNDWYVYLNFGHNGPTPATGSVQYTTMWGFTRSIKARELFELIVTYAHENGEPGLLFVDKANERNPHPELYTLEATNPCGEQWLGPYESCVLGSINLANYTMVNIVNGRHVIDYVKLHQDIYIYVHALDRMIDEARYAIPEIEEATKRTRRIGLGVMGFAHLLYRLGIRYDSQACLDLIEELGTFMRKSAHDASERLAELYGPYPAWKPGNALVPRPRRNAAVTCVAPTGTLARLANTSFGIEPVFASETVSRLRLSKQNPSELAIFEETDPMFRAWVQEHPDEPFPEHYVTAHEIRPAWHIAVMAAWQQSFSDNSISKTINAPFEATVEDAKKSARLAYDLGALGWTYYRDGSREDQTLTPGEMDCNGVACAIPVEEIAA